MRDQWDLDSIFSGGSESAQANQYLADLSQRIEGFGQAVASEELSGWGGVVQVMQEIKDRLRHISAYAGCLMAQNVKNEKARILQGQVRQLSATFNAILTQWDARTLQVTKEEWQEFLTDQAPVAFALDQRRQLAQKKLPPSQESLVEELSVDGYHAWSEQYNTIVGRIQVPWGDERLSVGQMRNKLSDPHREVRKAAFERLQEAWQGEADLCATTLNHLAGFRLALYRQRGWNCVHQEPLAMGRMSKETLEAMWSAVEEARPLVVRFLKRKAEILELPALCWYDLEAPIEGGSEKLSFAQGAEFVIEKFREFGPQMADLAQMAISQGWVEAQDRPGKAPGAFCTSLPVKQETRVFMTYSGTGESVSTLAHELGHAYHYHVMRDMPSLARDYAMNVAETASTFAEMVVIDAAIGQSSSQEVRLALIADKLQRAEAFLMNIYSRFLFETRFYSARQRGLVGVEELNSLMLEAQTQAYGGALAEYHPYFWAEKLHFYFTTTPFYNFPYTFGYLFSLGIYAQAKEEGSGFEKKYINLLRDTASMCVEDLAQKHLGVNLRTPEFWQMAVKAALADLPEFLQLTEA